MKTIYAVRIHHNNTIEKATRGHSKNYTVLELVNYFYGNGFQQWMDKEFLFDDEETARAKYIDECAKATSAYSGTSDTVRFDFVELISAEAESIEDYKEGICGDEEIWDCFCSPCKCPLSDEGYGIFTCEGRDYALTQDAYPADEDGKTVYLAQCIDSDGETHEMVWDTIEGWEEHEDASEHCDWDNPSEVR